MKSTVLIVDDAEINRAILQEMLEEKYNVLTAENGLEAIDIIKQKLDSISVVLLDLMMPKVDGFGVLDFLNENNLLKRIPVVIISGDSSVENEMKCFSYGIVDFIRKPFNEQLVKLRIGNVCDLYIFKNKLEDKVAEQTQKLNEQFMLVKQQAAKLAESNQKIVDILGTVVESRNLESGQHIQRVKNYTRILAEQMMIDFPEYGIDRHMIDVMVPASALHDVGKIAIPDSILLKPARLTADEFEIMKTHTTQGCQLLNNIKDAWDEEYSKMSYEICRHHHEKYDGKGYPDGLVGDDIPIAAQIVSIADVYDALVNERCYKDAFSKEQAYKMITTGECGAFSPKILESFGKVRTLFEAVGA